MKQSHYTTPRTMADGVWQPWADPVQRFEGSGPRVTLAYAVALVAACVVIGFALAQAVPA